MKPYKTNAVQAAYQALFGFSTLTAVVGIMADFYYDTSTLEGICTCDWSALAHSSPLQNVRGRSLCMTVHLSVCSQMPRSEVSQRGFHPSP